MNKSGPFPKDMCSAEELLDPTFFSFLRPLIYIANLSSENFYDGVSSYVGGIFLKSVHMTTKSCTLNVPTICLCSSKCYPCQYFSTLTPSWVECCCETESGLVDSVAHITWLLVNRTLSWDGQAQWLALLLAVLTTWPAPYPKQGPTEHCLPLSTAKSPLVGEEG